MKHDVLRQAVEYKKIYQKKKRWQKIVVALAAVVVFCTTYALILPAITMEKTPICGKNEHTHSEACYIQESAAEKTLPVCSVEQLNLHQHIKDCYNEQDELICGYADFVIHQHDSSCYDENGNLWCPLPEIEPHTHGQSCYTIAANTTEMAAHEHTDECYTMEKGELICSQAEVAEHQHTDDCYAWEQVLTCELSTQLVEKETAESSEPKLICEKAEVIPHQHSESCFGQNGDLICDKTEVLEHIHSSNCFETVEESADTEILNCQIPEHVHTEECYELEEEVDTALTEMDKEVVVEAVVCLIGEDENNEMQSHDVRAISSQEETRAASGSIAEHLTNAQIEINGEPYDGVSALNPGEQFTIALQWQLGRADLTDTLTYTYNLPEQIKIKDVAETVLYDENNNRKGVYSITGGVLTVTYDNVADLNTTTFKLNATWEQEKIGQETKVQWNDTLNTQVKFDNSQISVTKELLDYKTIEDGSLVGEYTVNVKTSSNVENINLEDTLTSEKFHFCQDYYEVNGEKYDYRYKIINSDGTYDYEYGRFPDGTFDENGKQLKNTITFPKFNLEEGQDYTVEYGVKLDANERFLLDKDQAVAGLTNSATASYPVGEDSISSTVTVTDTYQAKKKWIMKEQGKLGEGDVEQDTDVPWKVSVNPARDYDMGGAVIGDSIQTGGVVYKTDKPITITSTTDSSSDTATPQWIPLSDDTVTAIQSVGGKATDLLFSDVGQEVLKEINAAVGHEVKKKDLSNYVFVSQSKTRFVWFTPQTGTPTTYELSYITDISDAESNALANSASAGWKQWTAGVVTGSFLQEIGIEKKNDGVYQQGEDYLVDWTITLNVPAGRNAIPNVFLYDALPYHEESGGYDQLVGLSGSELDYTKVIGENRMNYLNQISHPAIQITSEDEAVQNIVQNATTSLGHPVVGMTAPDFKLYEEDNTAQGQLSLENGSGEFAGKRITPARFGVWLGNLPDTLEKEGYTITVKYTTKVDSKLIEGLNGRAYGYNYVGLMERQGETDILMGAADSSYWVDHSTAQNALAKSVADFDSEKNIITYKVNINPDANMEATPNAAYILRDVLDLPGATYVENSFQLAFQGKVEKVNNNYPVTWDSSKELLCWHAGWGENEWLSYMREHAEELGIEAQTWWNLVYYMGFESSDSQAAKLQVNNHENSSSDFNFTLTNQGNLLALAAPEEAKGNLVPMVLTYQVKLPDGTGTPTQEKITNSATLSMKPIDSKEVLIDGVKAEFDYTSALRKRLTVGPSGDNGYTATFVINVDKGAEEWKNVGNTFTVSDEMSKSLVVDITSIRVYGVKADGREELLSNNYTASYDDRTSEIQNYLSVTITDSDAYIKYRIEYDTKVQGEVGDTVTYDNVASVEGTEIKSEEITKDVYIQKQDASVVETNYEVKLLKFDAANTAVKLKAIFNLYAYENGEWVEKLSNLSTDQNGELVLNNTKYPDLGLDRKIWYKLVETNAPEGYLKGTTYFHIGQMGEGETKPEKIGNYTTIPLKGGIHQIPNYKASLRLHKMDEDKGETTYLTGAEFALYSSSDCSGTPLSTAREERKGIYSFELTGLTAGTSYYLKETKAPDGYYLSNTVYTVSFDEEGNVTLKNADILVQTDSSGSYLIANKCGFELPQTGGAGITLYTIGGLLLITGAGILLLYNYIKHRKEDFASF